MKQRVLCPCAGSIASRQTHLTGCSGCCLSVLYTGGLSKKHANPLSPRNPEERVGKNSCSFGRGERGCGQSMWCLGSSQGDLRPQPSFNP